MLVKTVEQEVTERMVASLIGKYIHVPTNVHLSAESGESVNAWFAGRVAGYERTVLHFDYLKEEFRDEPVAHFTLLLTDGMGYILSAEESVIELMTEEEFNRLAVTHLANKAAGDLVEESISNIISN